jgi:hypothetical protein
MIENNISQEIYPAGAAPPKPFVLDVSRATPKGVLRVAASIVAVFQLWLPAAAHAQVIKPVPNSDTESTAVTLSPIGKCDYSTNGVVFDKLLQGQLLEQGAIIRTSQDAHADLFFRRTGTIVRLQPDTEIKIEKMSVTMKGDLPFVHTLLDLHSGRIFTVVRSEVADSVFEIRNAAGRSVMEGSGTGKYIITADGSQVSAEGSDIPLKLMGQNGITIISAGQQFAPKDGKMLPLDTGLWVKDLIQLDELQSIMQESAAKDSTSK